MNAPALILPPRPARKARRPASRPASPAVQCPTRERSPEAFPPMIDADDAAWWSARADEAVEHQDRDPDAEWADLAPWMHRAVDLDGRQIEEGLGVGEAHGRHLVWNPWPAARA